MKPSRTDTFRPIEELAKYTDSEKYYCQFVSFSPEEDSVDFHDDPGHYPPPFIEIGVIADMGVVFYFEIPMIVAYYAVKHPCYTYAGLEQREEEGARKLKIELKNLLAL